MTDKEMRQYIMRHPWEHGWYGKGVVMPSGQPIAFRTDEYDSDSFDYTHRDAMEALGLTGPYGSAIPFIIAPDGRFALHYPDPESPDEATRIARAIDRIAALNPELTLDQANHHAIYDGE